jgi:MATE family multidrug resistance protein
MLLIVGAGFAWAVMPMVAKAASAGDQTQVRRVTRMGFWLVLIYAALVTPPMIWSAPWLVWLGQDPDTARLAQEYLRIAGLAMAPGLLVMVLKGYLSALERTAVVLWVTVGAAVLNGGLNYVLIFGRFGAPEMGVAGAAWASLSLHLVSLVALAIYARRVLPEHELFRRFWVPDWAAFGAVYRLGWPISLTSFAESGLFAASALMMGAIGTLELAAHGIALQMAALTFMVHVGLSQAATVRAGRALGRGDLAELKRGGAVAIALSVGFAVATICLFVAVPEVLIGAFISPDDPSRDAILGVGVTLLYLAALFQFADGAQVMALGLLRGVQDTKVPMIMASLAYWGVGLPVGFALGFYTSLGAVGIWLGLVAGLAVAAGLLMRRFWGPAGWQTQRA